MTRAQFNSLSALNYKRLGEESTANRGHEAIFPDRGDRLRLVCKRIPGSQKPFGARPKWRL